jgi:hypothetical protein
MFPKRRGISSTWQSRAQSLDGWRTAANLVWARWEAFLDAPPDIRGRAFAAYLAALDAEAAAAGEIADLPPTVTA